MTSAMDGRKNSMQTFLRSSPLRIGFFMNYPSMHMISLFDALSRREDCTISVVYCGYSDPGRKWYVSNDKISHKFLKGITIGSGGFQINPNIFFILKHMQIDIWVIDAGIATPSSWFAIHCINRKGTPWVYMSEPTRVRNSFFLRCKNVILRFFLRSAWGIIGTGVRAEKIYRDLVVSKIPTISIPYYIILQAFFELPIPAVRTEDKTINFVTVCQMIKRKALDNLIAACKLLPEKGWRLTLVGDGPLRCRLEKDCHDYWGDGKVKFAGEVPFEKRSLIFRDQHVFVFPSLWDGWGMALVEAMAAGLPVISTDTVGSAHEFISSGKNGFIIPSGDVQALAEKMKWFMEHQDEIPHMGEVARESLGGYDPGIGADKLVRFLTICLLKRGG